MPRRDRPKKILISPIPILLLGWVGIAVTADSNFTLFYILFFFFFFRKQDLRSRFSDFLHSTQNRKRETKVL